MSVALPANIVDGKNFDNETWFHLPSPYLLNLTLNHNLNRFAARATP